MPRAQSKSVEPPTVPADERERQRVDGMTASQEAEFLMSLREAHAKGRPISYFRQWPVEYLIKANLPKEWMEKCGLTKAANGVVKPLPLQCGRAQFIAHVNEVYGKPNNKQWVLPQIAQWAAKGFPINKGKSNLNSKPCLDWFLQNVFDPATVGAAGPGEETVIMRQQKADAITKEQNAERATRANLEEKRKCDARWTLMEVLMFLGEGWWTIIRQLRILQKKKSLDNARAAGKAAGIDEAALERQQALMRDLEEADYAAWQNELDGDPNVPGSLGKLGELEKAAKELSDQKKAELKIKI